jgi:hypothetical protein
MKIKFKLFATLADYLPQPSRLPPSPLLARDKFIQFLTTGFQRLAIAQQPTFADGTFGYMKAGQIALRTRQRRETVQAAVILQIVKRWPEVASSLKSVYQ